MENAIERENAFPPPHSDVYIPWTIESQLKSYATHLDATERHEVLWYSWKQIKRWLSQMLEYTLASFPAYSLHNETHCQAILHNIECLLGEPEIRKLSATDCFVILIAVYLHDIGMVITYSDRQDMLQSDSFSELIDELRNSSSSVLQKAAAELQDVNYDFRGEPDRKARMKKLYEKKLKVFDAMSLILGEHQRKLHAKISEQRVKKWTDGPSKLQAGLELTQIPMRIFYQAAVCAELHGESDFTLIEKCPQKDGGYAHDWYHPRFVAALLIIGDGLDLDNDRFHLFMEDFSGADFITETTITHINKHRSIRTLQISPRKIEISADCKTAESLRTLCNEIRWLEGFLKNCTYKWNEIAPENFSGSLPNISLNPIRLNGTEIPAEMVTTRFAISQEKAFSLLQGSHIYNSHFTFLRELIQNACDAVKLQYWEDYSASTYTGNVCSANPQEANASIALSKYPIYIYLSVKKLSSGFEPELSDITGEDLKNIKQLKETHKFGVLLEVQDFGIGISKNDIKEIAKVGTSHARQKTAIQKMPSWLRPTGHFGVGLQSLFLVCNNFKCITKTRSGECYDMTFHSRMNQDGYINVIPHPGVDSKGNTIPYGSRFSVFIEETFKESHETNMDGWAAIDPYRPDYEMLRSLRRSVELMAFLCAMALLEVAQIHDSLHDDKANGCVHPGEDLPCIWAYLNEQMEQLMNSVDESLKDKASDFHGDVSETWHEYACVPTLRWDTLSQVRWKSISEIFDSKHHYAIFSNRTSSGSKWLHALVEIPDYAWDLLNESPQTEDFCNKHWHKLNQWCQAFVNDLINAWDVSPSGRDNTVGRRKNESTTKLWESPVVRWMIHSIPSIALASDIGGMNRLNVLSLHARPSIYKDSHMINLLLDRMRHLSEDRSIERMQLLTLDGLSALNVTDSVTSNIIPATRGCVSSENKKNRMLMAFGSSLPQAVTLSLETMDADNANNPITSVYQLFDALKEPYHTGDSRFLPDKAKFILKVCKQAAWQAEPFYKNVYANIDDKLWNRIVRVHKCFLNEEKRPEGSSLDLRYQESPNQRQLLNIMQKAYEGILTDADQSLKGVHQDSSLKWSDIEFLSNPEKFFNTVILQIFGYAVFPSQIKGSFLPMSNAVAEDFAYYDDYNTYKNEISKVWNGIRYLRDFAADDYENAFVKLVLNWWEDAIWNKDSCSETLLNARASDLRTAISKEDLKHMYLRQIEFFIRSVVSDVPSAVNQYKLERWASITSKEE